MFANSRFNGIPFHSSLPTLHLHCPYDQTRHLIHRAGVRRGDRVNKSILHSEGFILVLTLLLRPLLD